MTRQKRLFEHYNPIENRLGKSFFEELPRKPGVYKMYGGSGDLLYVGKAKDLRNRLLTYRRAKMGTTSRKKIRLIRMTHDINIQICESEREAILLELDSSLIPQKKLDDYLIEWVFERDEND